MITSACVVFYTKDNKRYEIPCHRHADAFYIISQFLPSNMIDKEKTWQGFYNDKGQLLDRYEAYREAHICNQIDINFCDLIYCKELYSEDVW